MRPWRAPGGSPLGGPVRTGRPWRTTALSKSYCVNLIIWKSVADCALGHQGLGRKPRRRLSNQLGREGEDGSAYYFDC